MAVAENYHLFDGDLLGREGHRSEGPVARRGFADPIARCQYADSTLKRPSNIGRIENISRRGGRVTVSDAGIL